MEDYQISDDGIFVLWMLSHKVTLSQSISFEKLHPSDETCRRENIGFRKPGEKDKLYETTGLTRKIHDDKTVVNYAGLKTAGLTRLTFQMWAPG